MRAQTRAARVSISCRSGSEPRTTFSAASRALFESLRWLSISASSQKLRNGFSETPACSKQRYRHGSFRGLQHSSDFLNREPFDMPQNKHLGGSGTQLRQSGVEAKAEFRCRMLLVRSWPVFSNVECSLVQRSLPRACTNDVQRDIYRRAMQVSGPAGLGIGKPLASHQSQKERLKHILGVGSVPGDSKGDPINHFVIFEERLFDFFRVNRVGTSLNWQYQLLAVSRVSITLTLEPAED